ncbi:hypothetical protein EOA88_00385 [Mesorhizobium sp. M5C.F.Ca.IN.020.14.1.1]|nr:hypothetical protein EOA88_00385 [Mesorhizobium sp. M5C.F.Ca.IN.020.14.1.1]
MNLLARNVHKPTWRIRRRMVVLVLLWSSGMVTYLAVWGQADSLRESIATALILLMGSTLGSYVFGAVWDDKNVMQSGVDTQAVEAGIPPTSAAGTTVVVQPGDQQAGGE